MPRKMQTSAQTENRIFAVRLRECMDEIRTDTGKPTTQEQLAAAVGVIRQTISNYMNGQSDPDWETLARIAQYFGVSADYLIGISDIKALSTDMRSVIEYSGLSEDAVFTLVNMMKTENLAHISDMIITESKPGTDLVKESICSFLADGSSYYVIACIANLKKCCDNANMIFQSINSGNNNLPKAEQRKALSDAVRSIRIARFDLTESIRELAGNVSQSDSIEYNINQLISNNYPLFDNLMKGGAQDAENSPES